MIYDCGDIQTEFMGEASIRFKLEVGAYTRLPKGFIQRGRPGRNRRYLLI